MNYLIGHLVGDILLQNKWLAEKKIITWYGILLHSLIITFAMWLFTFWDWKKLLLVFISHFIIDKFQLGKKYPDFVKMGKPFTNQNPPEWLRLLSDQIFHLTVYYFINLLNL